MMKVVFVPAVVAAMCMFSSCQSGGFRVFGGVGHHEGRSPGHHKHHGHGHKKHHQHKKHHDPVQRYYSEHYPHGLAKKGKLPPGLAKKGKIPPGWQKKYKRGDSLPHDCPVEKLPRELEYKLPPLPRGQVRVRVGGNILILNRKTRVVLDVLYQF